MFKKNPNSDKLATLQELRYLLLEVLDRPQPISWYDLSFSCKELSLNFAFAFENTMAFFQLLSLVHIHADHSVSRVEEDYSALSSDQEFSVFIMEKTVAYLETNKFLEQVFNKNTVITDLTSDVVVMQLHEIPADFLFIRSLLLNLGIVVADKSGNGKLLVVADYKTYFREELLPKVFTDMPLKDVIAIDPGRPATIPTFFISYADEDKEFKNELQKHISGLKRSGLISDWEGRAILPGQDWEDEIRQKLEQAKVVLFLVSSDFIDSDYINDVEIKNTIERHKQGLVKIIPVIVRPCDFDSLPIKRYQALPDRAKAISQWENRDEAYVSIVDGIKKVIKQMSNQKS